MSEDFYEIKSGDTLSAIAAAHGTTVAELVRINGLKNPNRLQVGQRLHLKAQKALAVRPLFLDAARNPIMGMKYRLQCGTHTILGSTQANGLGDQIITRQPEDIVSIWAQIPWEENQWQQIAEVQSDVGEKLVTLISPMLRIKAPLHPHPKDASGIPKTEQQTEQHDQDPLAQHPRGTPQKSQGTLQSAIVRGGPGIRSRTEIDDKGLSREVLSEDLPDLKDCFSAYTGEPITEVEWRNAALQIGCEAATIKAFAEVETGGQGGFLPNSGKPPLPKILYERYLFSRLTHHKYDADNADLSMSTRFLAKLKHTDPTAYTVDRAIPTYVTGIANYRRFLKACLLDEDAAIECCSWGAFQILGENWQVCRFTNRRQFLRAAFTSEKAHLLMMFVPYVLNFAQGKLKCALVDKDWISAAKLYNGPREALGPPGYKGRWIPYHARLEKAYEKYKNNN